MDVRLKYIKLIWNEKKEIKIKVYNSPQWPKEAIMRPREQGQGEKLEWAQG